MIFLSVVLFMYGNASPIDEALELEKIFPDQRSIRGPRQTISESSGDNQDSSAVERSLQLSGDIGDRDSAAKFEGSADFALTGMKLPFNESSGDGIDERSLFSGDSAEEVISERSLSGFAGSGDHQFTGMALFVAESSGEGVDERALVYISEEINSFSGDNEEDIADPRSLVTFEKPDELAQFYDYENITDSFSGDDGDDVEERSMFTDLEIHDVLNAALQKNVDMLEGVIEEAVHSENSSSKKLFFSCAVFFIFIF
ncbi:unnamed protein product [Oikopleura dioica]|uniref:Uncharacterized protein n=1 Tax=Oikopleura dioica TaxID=34765 RepID=E4XM59_OIKDI|nr:unnamed protein product [Oikopleura dioica]